MAIIVTRATSALVAGTGTITTSTSSTTVTGVGTLFTTEVDYVGKALYTSADVYIGTVASIASNTSLTLSANAAVAVTGGGYKHGYLPKNNPLSNTEIDTNFINLNNNKLEVTDTSAVNIGNTVVRRDASGNFAAGTITATTFSGALSGNATTATTLQTSRNINGVSFNGSADIVIPRISASDDRIKAPADDTNLYATYGFTSWANNNTAPYADYLHLRSYSDASGGNDNLIMFNKNAIGMRIWQQTWNSSTAYSSYKDVCWTDGTNATGTWSISISGTATTATTANATNTSNNFQMNSLGVGTAASGTAGEIRATNSITSWYSDERLKENVAVINNALEKLIQLDGVTFNANSVAEEYGFTDKSQQVGVLAQQVEKVLPEAVKPAPFDIMLYENTEISRTGENYKTVQYEKLVPLLIQAVKELNEKLENMMGDK
jgi:hypothetical protein